MATVNDPEYQAALREFGIYMRGLHRRGGEVSYREVAKVTGTSPATVHRYLHGSILPRWSFLVAYLAEYGPIMGFDATDELKARWMSVRNILKPIPDDVGPIGTSYHPPRRLTAVPTSEPPGATRRKPA
ncbi:helix-turn-helix domain-containing protein (plasmid) [Actinoplanes sp. CA-051413]|uniref:helix-turn-helix domain-containing protein n=1 Tax=Actinoplanes sp. CA-051413 TaxID=3239899 RepID=UPI003D95E708